MAITFYGAYIAPNLKGIYGFPSKLRDFALRGGQLPVPCGPSSILKLAT